MSYRCKPCGCHVPDGRKLLRHVVTRTMTPTTTTTRKVTRVVNGQATARFETVELPTGPPHTEVAREVPVCESCHQLLGVLMRHGHGPAEALRELAHAQHVETPDWSGPPEPARAPTPTAVQFPPAEIHHQSGPVKFGGA